MEMEKIDKFKSVITSLIPSSRCCKIGISEAFVKECLTMTYKQYIESEGITMIDDVNTTSAIAKSAQWLCGGLKCGLLLYGTIGSGKTTLARAITTTSYVLSNKNILPLNINAIDVARCCEADKDTYKQYLQQEMLLIDDMGCEPTSVKSYGTEYTPLIELLYKRLDKRLLTLITTNLSLRLIADTYGLRVWDRMKQMFVGVEFKNKSYRL
jgi:DNA replication protein DnaC